MKITKERLEEIRARMAHPVEYEIPRLNTVFTTDAVDLRVPEAFVREWFKTSREDIPALLEAVDSLSERLVLAEKRVQCEIRNTDDLRAQMFAQNERHKRELKEKLRSLPLEDSE